MSSFFNHDRIAATAKPVCPSEVGIKRIEVPGNGDVLTLLELRNMLDVLVVCGGREDYPVFIHLDRSHYALRQQGVCVGGTPKGIGVCIGNEQEHEYISCSITRREPRRPADAEQAMSLVLGRATATAESEEERRILKLGAAELAKVARFYNWYSGLTEDRAESMRKENVK